MRIWDPISGKGRGGGWDNSQADDDTGAGTTPPAAGGFGSGFGGTSGQSSKPSLLGQGEAAPSGFGRQGTQGSGFGNKPSLLGGFASITEPEAGPGEAPKPVKSLVPPALQGGVGAPSPLAPHMGRRTPGEVATSSPPGKNPPTTPESTRVDVKAPALHLTLALALGIALISIPKP